MLSPSFLPSWQNQKFGELPGNFKTIDGHILIAGFPKSGNVWLTSLVAGCLDLPVEKKDGQCYVHYTHKALSNEWLYDRGLLRGAVIIRDLRDIIVSLFHWLKTDGYRNYYKHGPHQIFDDIETMYIEFFLRRFSKMPMADLADSYVEKGWPVVKYERLFDNTVRELERLFQVWGVEVPSKKINSVVSANTISNIKRAGVLESYIEPDHFRKGGHGNYVHEIPEKILKDIELRFGDYLMSWGYEIGVSAE
jgi:hypothetical protein